MLQSLLYTGFFVSLDLFIYMLLTEAMTVKISKLSVMGIIAALLLTSLFIPDKITSLQPLYQFYGLLLFSFGLFIFDYAAGAMIVYTQSSHGMWGSMPQGLQNVSVSALNFFRFRLVYFMVLSAQLIDIWQNDI